MTKHLTKPRDHNSLFSCTETKQGNIQRSLTAQKAKRDQTATWRRQREMRNGVMNLMTINIAPSTFFPFNNTLSQVAGRCESQEQRTRRPVKSVSNVFGIDFKRLEPLLVFAIEDTVSG
ncbi:hypothetical protein ElyMa_003587900 [Elysia marginata]|uniref:Uncharacterized protein n=1 Tax=Elysia marginata TaxID=1093978 RepID=A0AAV4EQ21_9GAST|nr:hypothetical protein ElyMa_003587900 [Elysia marginata]